MINCMEHVLPYIALGLLGVSIGSFCGATIWRLRARQLQEDKRAGEKVDSREYDMLKRLIKPPLHKDRSMCLHCHHTLQWYDLLPLVSWLLLGGKCRYCHKTIGMMEPLIEFGTALVFIASYAFWPVALGAPVYIAIFVLWLIAVSGLIILFVYDAKWYLLPNKVVFPVMAIAALSAILHVVIAADPIATALSLLGSACILSGIYLLLFIVSSGAWIGFGDIKLGLVLALLVVDWRLAFLTLFVANLIGCILVIPGLIQKKLSQGSRVPFGPMLIAACVIVMLFGYKVVDWYFGSMFM